MRKSVSILAGTQKLAIVNFVHYRQRACSQVENLKG